MKSNIEKIAGEYCLELKKALGPQVRRVVIFGSQARGDADAGSDIDVLCVLSEAFDYGEMIRRTSEFTAAISLKHAITISRVFATETDYSTRQLPFYINVRREGVAV